MASKGTILVTGGSGFVGAHCIIAATAQGYNVRTTIRSLKRSDEVREMLKAGDLTEDQANGVEIIPADLTSDDGWTDACKGCRYVLHVASPFPGVQPKNENDLIIPAREGTLRVLRAAKAAGTVKRVVITSSVAAIAYGHPQQDRIFTEGDWTVLDSPTRPVPAYPKSKTIAERAAWDWIAKEGGDMELATVNPAGIWGPVLGKDTATSVELIIRLLKGQMPGLPNVGFGCVDVRDVADLHLLAMTDPKAAGQRFIAVSDEGFVWAKDVALKIKARMGDKASKVPTRVIPDFVLKIVAWFDSGVGLIVPELGSVKNSSNKKAKDMLGWRPRSAEDALVSNAESLYRFGLIE